MASMKDKHQQNENGKTFSDVLFFSKYKDVCYIDLFEKTQLQTAAYTIFKNSKCDF